MLGVAGSGRGVDSLNLICACCGLFGAFMFASPNLSKCLFITAKAEGGSCWQCITDASIALFSGAGAAVIFAPWAQALSHHTEPNNLAAIATVIGLIASPVAPHVASLATRFLDKKAS